MGTPQQRYSKFVTDITRKAAHLKYALMVDDIELRERMISELVRLQSDNDKLTSAFIMYSDSPYLGILERYTSFGCLSSDDSSGLDLTDEVSAVKREIIETLDDVKLKPGD